MSNDMTSRELYLRLLSYVRPYWKAFVAALVCLGLASLAEPVFPAMMKYLLDDGFSKVALGIGCSTHWPSWAFFWPGRYSVSLAITP